MAVVVLAAFGLYQRLWTYVGQRDYENVVKAVVVATILIVGAIAILHPVQYTPRAVQALSPRFVEPRSRCRSA